MYCARTIRLENSLGQCFAELRGLELLRASGQRQCKLAEGNPLGGRPVTADNLDRGLALGELDPAADRRPFGLRGDSQLGRSPRKAFSFSSLVRAAA